MSGDVLASARLVVLDLTTSVAGGFCAGLLARMGADVDRIESRANRSGQSPQLDSYIHCGKRRSCLELDSPSDQAVLDRCAARADIIVLDNPPTFCPGEPDEGRTRVLVSLQGTLTSDDDLDAHALDVSLWAESGLLDLARGTTGEPVLPPGFQASYQVGLHAAVTAMAAAIDARIRCESATIEVEASEVLPGLLLASGELDRDDEAASYDGLRTRSARRSRLVEAADGEAFLNASSVYFDDLRAFAHGWGLLDHDSDQSVEDFGGSAALELQGWSRAQLVERAQEWRLPAGAVMSLEELERDEQIRHRGTLVSIDDRRLGTVVMPWLPWTETELTG